MGPRGRGHPPAGTAHKTPDTAGEGASQVFVEGGAHPAARAGHGAAVVRVSSLGFLSPARLSRAGGPQRAGDGAGLAKVRQEGPGRPGQGVRQWRTAAFPARSAEKAGGPGWPRPRDTGVLGRPARSLELRKQQPSQRGGRKSKITGQLRWFRPGAQRDDLSLGAVLGSGACRQSSARRPSLPHVTWWAVCPDSPLKGTPFAGLGPTRVQEDLLSVLSFITPAQVQLHHQTIV